MADDQSKLMMDLLAFEQAAIRRANAEITRARAVTETQDSERALIEARHALGAHVPFGQRRAFLFGPSTIVLVNHEGDVVDATFIPVG